MYWIVYRSILNLVFMYIKLKSKKFRQPFHKVKLRISSFTRDQKHKCTAKLNKWNLIGFITDKRKGYTYTGCPVDFASIGKRDHSCNFFSNGLPLNTFGILISDQMEALEFLKNLENWKNFYLGEKGWSKSNLEQLLPPTPWIFVFSFFHSFVDFTIKTAWKTNDFIFFDNFQSIGNENF